MIITEEEAKKKGLEEILKKVNNGEQVTIIPIQKSSKKLEKKLKKSRKSIKQRDYTVIKNIEKHAKSA